MVTIRPAAPDDAPVIVAMSHAVAAHEGAPIPGFTEPQFLAHGFGEAALFECFVAEREGDVVGHVTFTRSFDFQEGCPSLWLADLYVVPGARKVGVGRALLSTVARRAQELEARLIQWMVAPKNPEAAGFYVAIGAKRDGGIPMFLEQGAIAKLAKGA